MPSSMVNACRLSVAERKPFHGSRLEAPSKKVMPFLNPMDTPTFPCVLLKEVAYGCNPEICCACFSENSLLVCQSGNRICCPKSPAALQNLCVLLSRIRGQPSFHGTLFVEILYTYALYGKYKLSILLFLSPPGVSASFSHIYVLQNQHPTICGLPLW